MFFTILGAIFTYGIPLLVLLAIVGFRKSEGMWGNIISTINVTFAILVAVNYWEPLANFLANQWVGALYVVDYFSIWLIFIITLAALEEISMRLSRVKVKFPEQVEMIGGHATGVVLFLILFFGFHNFTMLLSPLPAEDNMSASPVASLMGNGYDFLSTGNLVPFTGETPFSFQKVVDDHTQRRIALKVQGAEKTTLFYEGPVPGQ